MSPNFRSILATVLVLMAPLPACVAGTLECHGNIVSQGDTEARLLETCGKPASRNGADWLYEMPGSLPVVVTMANGIIMLIRDPDEVRASPANPLGDHP